MATNLKPGDLFADLRYDSVKVVGVVTEIEGDDFARASIITWSQDYKGRVKATEFSVSYCFNPKLDKIIRLTREEDPLSAMFARAAERAKDSAAASDSTSDDESLFSTDPMGGPDGQS